MFSLKNLKNLDRDDLLDLVGLQTRQTTGDWLVPTLGAFGVGLLVGAGIGLLLAPKPGRELRDDLRHRLQGATDQISGSLLGKNAGATAAEAQGGVRT